MCDVAARAGRLGSSVLPVRECNHGRESMPASVVSLQTGSFDVHGGRQPVAVLDAYLQTSRQGPDSAGTPNLYLNLSNIDRPGLRRPGLPPAGPSAVRAFRRPGRALTAPRPENRWAAYTLSAAGKLRRTVSGRYKLWHQDGTAL